MVNLAVLGEWLNLTILDVFSILNDPMAENWRLPALDKLNNEEKGKLGPGSVLLRGGK